jgi:hypothetical protein
MLSSNIFKRAVAVVISGFIFCGSGTPAAHALEEILNPAGQTPARGGAMVLPPQIPGAASGLAKIPTLAADEAIALPSPAGVETGAVLDEQASAAPAFAKIPAGSAPPVISEFTARLAQTKADGRAFDGALLKGKLVEQTDWLRLAAHKFLTHPRVQNNIPSAVLNLEAVKNQQQPPKPRVVLDTTDDFGGPPPLPDPNHPSKAGHFALNLRRNVAYGLKWGGNMMGMAVLIQIVLGTILAVSGWQLHVPDSVLHSMGRVELLTSMGPEQIAQALVFSPIRFLFETLPLLTALETLKYLVLPSFLFLSPWLLMQIKKRPIASLALKFVRGSARAMGWNEEKTARAVKLLAKAAFPIIAMISAFHFSTAHFAAWGASPLNLVLFGSLGYVLAHVLYRSRSLTAPFVAHLTFSVAFILSLLLPLPLLLAVYAASVVFLFINWRLHRKAVAAAYAQAKADAAGKDLP